MDLKNSAFLGIKKIYNQSIKKMMKLPAHTAHDIVDNTFCGNSIENIVKKNYRSNITKWQRIYEEDVEQTKNQIIQDKVNKHIESIDDDLQLNSETKINNKVINKKL